MEFTKQQNERIEAIKQATIKIQEAEKDQDLNKAIKNLRIINPYLKSDDSYISALKSSGYLKWML